MGSEEIIVKTKLGEYKIPKGLLYTKTDEWVKIKDDIAIVGITDYAQKKLRFVVNIELPNIGSKVNEGDTIATLESVKTIADVYSPVRGEVIEVNEELSDTPDIINKDPYGNGWIVKIKILDNPKAYYDKLMKAEEYAEKIRSEEK